MKMECFISKTKGTIKNIQKLQLMNLNIKQNVKTDEIKHLVNRVLFYSKTK